MSDPIIATPPVAGAPVAEPATLPAPVVEEPFDKERAMATIKNLREFEKTAKAQAKLLAEYEAKDKAAKDAELSEVERLKKQVAEAATERERVTQEIATLRLRQAVEREAVRLGFANPEDAYLLADMTGVTMDDDGKIEGVKEAIEKIVKTRPYLVKAQANPIGTPRQGARIPVASPPSDARKVLGIRL